MSAQKKITKTQAKSLPAMRIPIFFKHVKGPNEKNHDDKNKALTSTKIIA
jgi:hypothetical protein